MIAVVDYGMGNVGSIVNMFRRLNVKVRVCRDVEAIAEASRLVMPGVGAFDQGMEHLETLGFREALTHKVLVERVPVLGICLGMQLMTKGSEEGTKPGLSWLNARTVHLRTGAGTFAESLKFPHIGWNFVSARQRHPLLDWLPPGCRFYFVHNYTVECHEEDDALTATRYGEIEFTSAFIHENMAGVQFHPEKSHTFGMQLFNNFARWSPAAAPSRRDTVSHQGSIDPAPSPLSQRPRVMPVLLLKNDLLYKTVRFKAPKYVGDPRIAVKLFNDKGADELVLLDITATVEKRRPNFKLIEEIAGECFMPLAYGGGIRSEDDVRTLFNLGVEKVIINTRAVEDPGFVTQAARVHGSQSIVVSIDAKRDLFGRYRVVTEDGRRKTKLDPVTLAQDMAKAGAGEVLINSIDQDGTRKGYDIELIRAVATGVDVPVIACGGAGKLEDLRQVVKEGRASAAAAGSMFVFQGPYRAVLITFPEDGTLRSLFA